MSGLSGFKAVRLAGAVMPADALARASDGAMPGQETTDYGLVGTLTINAAAARAWDVLLPAYQAWKTGLAKLSGSEAATGYTRDKWLLPLLYEFGYGRPTPLHAGVDLPPGLGETKPAHFTLSHQLAWPADTETPTAALAIHLLGPGVDLERKTPGLTARAPHAMLQELLNRSPERLWALLSNGSILRVLRDASSLARQSYMEFDLDLIFENQLYADFRLLFTVLHATRFAPRGNGAAVLGGGSTTDDIAEDDDTAEVILEVVPTGPTPDDCWMEEWRTVAINDGARALEALRDGVATAITALGTGFVSHPANGNLVNALAASDGTTTDLHRWLLRIAYQLIVLFVAEDRDLLHKADADPDARARYEQYFSSVRLRRLAATRTGSRHSDLWDAYRIVTDALGGDGNPALALPGLAASLYEPEAIGILSQSRISNRHFLAAVRALSLVTDKQTTTTRPVDYRNLDSEELGSVYEGLLAYVPRYDPIARTFVLKQAAGNERKRSGSYYTPSDLITLVLDESLDSLIDRALRAPDPEAALLAITVCDPACGSGHFLVAAARRIAKALASVRTGDPEPPPEYVRTALRDVVARCIYGVDINDLAIEIAKVALWLETLEHGKPLAFLDGHLKVGNALLGATPKLLRANIPDTAFTVLDSDDVDWTRKLKHRNKTERERPLEQDALFSIGAIGGSTVGLSKRLVDIEAYPDRSLADVRARADAWRRFAADPELQRAKRLADAWCAAFVQPKAPSDGSGITHQIVQQLQDNPEEVPSLTSALIDDLARDFRFFHWHLEFPGIFTVPETGTTGTDSLTGWLGGFSCLLGNPPWERVKIQEKEWFSAAGRDDIAEAGNAAKRRRAIEALVDDDPVLLARFRSAQRKAAATAHFLLKSGHYPNTGRGDVNTYSVFAETFSTVMAANGAAGIVTPTGLVTDKTTSGFFGSLVSTKRLAALHDFVTNPRIWTDVGNRKFRFAVTAIRGRSMPVERIRMSFFSKYPTEVTPERVFSITPDEIQLLNPNTGNCPVFVTRADADLTIGVYRRHPIFIHDDTPQGNPWGVTFMRMFDMANDSGLFLESSDLTPTKDGGWLIRTRDGERVPLYEAKLLWHYDHRLSSYALRAPGSRDTELPRLSNAMHDDPNAEAFPRYWVDRVRVTGRLMGRWDRGWLLGWRDITGPALMRTCIACVLPTAAVGDQFPLAFPAKPGMAYLLHSTWSSLACDFIVRQKITGVHLKYFILKQVAIPHPDSFQVSAPWNPEKTLAEWIRPFVLELSYTSSRLRPYAEELGDYGEPFRWVPDRRAVLQAELDAAYMHIYGFQRGDVEHILGTFRTLAANEERLHGEYRTRRLVIAAYDRMTEAIHAGGGWSTTAAAPAGFGPRHSVSRR
jgi:hypothetical protein